MPECTKCGTELEFDDTCDQEVDTSEIYLYVGGVCPKCNKKFKWTEHYSFEKFTDLREA